MKEKINKFNNMKFKNLKFKYILIKIKGNFKIFEKF